MYLVKWNSSTREYEDYKEALSRASSLLKEGHKKVLVFKLITSIVYEKDKETRTHYTGL